MARVTPTAAAKTAPAPQKAASNGPQTNTTAAAQQTSEVASGGNTNPDGKKPRKPRATTAVKRIHHPLLQAQEKTIEKSGKKVIRPTAKLKEIPADYNPKLHKPLSRRDFDDESLALEWQAKGYEEKAKSLREQATELRGMGGIKDRAEAKKLLALQKRMLEMTASLEARGVNVDKIKAKLAADLQAKSEVAQDAPKSVEGATAS